MPSGLWTSPMDPSARQSNVSVEAYAGYKGEETPRAFTLDGKRRTVRDILERWYTERYAVFKLLADDGGRYILRYHLDQGAWELVMRED